MSLLVASAAPLRATYVCKEIIDRVLAAALLVLVSPLLL